MRKTTFTLALIAALLAASPSRSATPEELGKRIGTLYIEAIREVADLMESRPPAEELQPKVEALKESHVQKLVALGKKKEVLSDSEKAVVNRELRAAMRDMPGDLFNRYAEGQQHYRKEGASDLARTISDFNVITQYADFELLKKQNPEEAKRLGIE